MPFDQKKRNLLQRTVTACRRVFDREFTAQLQELYGIQPDGAVTPCEALDHLADEELEVARLLRSRINHLEGGEPTEALTRTKAKPEHVARVIREQAFTILNRLAALRLCEERGLVLECVRQGINSEGFRLFLTSAGNALGETHEAYRVYLYCVFDELSIDLGVLFDRFSPMALLFPRKDALEEVLRELNGSGKAAESEAIPAEQFAEIWQADEAIGWIYQYYNDEAERKKMREESSAPRNSRELAVRNQFFTPRYVVEFLTDNTLGRFWYEATRGETTLRNLCPYLVRRPTEIFLKAGEAVPESAAGSEAQAGEYHSQEELLRQPVHIPHRSLKDPREIRLLDPACGSMHFGLYAFDLFTVIYDEAWEIAHGPDDAAKSASTFAPFVTFAATFPDKAAFLLEVPRLIVEHNIHGIDIDPRAAQIAGLSLWLRAQRAWHQAGVRPPDRPRITRSKIVCAEPMPGEKELLREFVEGQFVDGERPAFAFLLEKIFDRMTLAGEAGSLLRIEEEIRGAISEASAVAQRQSAPRQNRLWEGDDQPEQSELDLRGLNDEQFWQRVEQRIYDALEAYAEQAENGGGFQRRLFADDAAQGFAFIDLCRKRYDVVVMNPPFGQPTVDSFKYVRTSFPNSYTEALAAFVERGNQLSLDYVGAITSRSFMVANRLGEWRKLIGVPNINLIADLGENVMDGAFVEAAAYTLTKARVTTMLAFDVRKADDLAFALKQCVDSENTRDVYCIPRAAFYLFPKSRIVYSLPIRIISLLQLPDRFEPLSGTAREGFRTWDDFRFVRANWEVDPSRIGRSLTWEPLMKGGPFSRYRCNVHLLVGWDGEGRQSRAINMAKNGTDAQARQASDYWRRRGITYSTRSQKGFSARVLPEGCLFTGQGPLVVSETNTSNLYLLGWLNSQLVTGLLEIQANDGKFLTGLVKTLPWIPPNKSRIASIEDETVELLNKLFHLAALEECNQYFFCPPVGKTLQEASSVGVALSLSSLMATEHVDGRWNDYVNELYQVDPVEVAELERQVSFEEDIEETDDASDDEVATADWCQREVATTWLSFIIGAIQGRWDIRTATGERRAPVLPDPFAPLPVCPPGMLQGDDGLPLSPEAGRGLRAEGRYPLDVAWDGILVDDSEHPLDLERCVRAGFAVLWGDRADDLEHEACALLGVPTLREWFRRPAGFFADHLKRYSKSRRQAPIYWPLSTASGRYTLWLYYHRLTPDTLYKCIQQFVAPKLADLEKELIHLGTVLAANEGSGKERKRMEELEDLRRELIEFRTELEFWAPKWKPNLNDGVLITAAPLWKLFRLSKWQKDLKACWQELEKGDYDWAHLAYTLWPDRVREKCKTDRSLAIAHGLEDLCEVETPVKKAKKSKTPKIKDDQQELPKH